MINFVLYNHSNQLFQLEYIDKVVDTLFVTPNPSIADEVRQNITGEDIDVLTISKFVLNELDEIEVIRKSDLYFELAKVWTLKFNVNINEFEKVFYLFTELRSISLNFDMILELISESLELNEIAELKFLDNYVRQRQLIDEQLSYFLISEQYRTSNVDNIHEKRNIVFTGFKFLNAGQVDFLNALSIQNDVYICIPRKIFDILHDRDWPNWFNEKILIDLENNEDTICSSIVRFPKSRMCEYLDIYNEEEINEVVLCGKNIDFEQVNELPIDNKLYKMKYDEFDNCCIYIYRNLCSLLSEDGISSTNYILAINDISSKALIDENYILYKTSILYLDCLRKWESLSDIGDALLNAFELRIFFNNAKLDLPRVFLTNQIEKDYCKITDISNTVFIPKNKTVLCASSDYSVGSSADNSIFPLSIQKKLLTIAPLRRNKLESEYIKTGILSILNSLDSILFLESDIEESNDFWFDILNDCNFNEVTLTPKSKVIYKKKYPQILDSLISLSPSKIQTFIDCPHKYYINYIEKLNNTVPIDNTVRAFEIGQIEHLIIEKYFNDDTNIDHISFCRKYINEFLEKNSITVSKAEEKRLILEIENYTSNGIGFVENIRNFLGDISLYFEKEIIKQDSKGRVDLEMSNDDIICIFDFKRSDSSIPTKKELIGFENIQTWYYLSSLYDNHTKVVFGYINLSDIKNSLIYSNIPELDTLSQVKIQKIDNISTMLTNYSKHESEIIVNIRNESKFIPKIRKSSVCNFCKINIICTKGL